MPEKTGCWRSETSRKGRLVEHTKMGSFRGMKKGNRYSGGVPTLGWCFIPNLKVQVSGKPSEEPTLPVSTRHLTEWSMPVQKHGFQGGMGHGSRKTWKTCGRLQRKGFAMSFESWADGELVGLYGVKIGKCFFGESMFNKRNDASSALWSASSCGKKRDPADRLPDANRAPVRMGAHEIPRKIYLQLKDWSQDTLKKGTVTNTTRAGAASWSQVYPHKGQKSYRIQLSVPLAVLLGLGISLVAAFYLGLLAEKSAAAADSPVVSVPAEMPLSAEKDEDPPFFSLSKEQSIQEELDRAALERLTRKTVNWVKKESKPEPPKTEDDKEKSLHLCHHQRKSHKSWNELAPRLCEYDQTAGSTSPVLVDIPEADHPKNLWPKWRRFNPSANRNRLNTPFRFFRTSKRNRKARSALKDEGFPGASFSNTSLLTIPLPGPCGQDGKTDINSLQRIKTLKFIESTQVTRFWKLLFYANQPLHWKQESGLLIKEGYWKRCLSISIPVRPTIPLLLHCPCYWGMKS